MHRRLLIFKCPSDDAGNKRCLVRLQIFFWSKKNREIPFRFFSLSSRLGPTREPCKRAFYIGLGVTTFSTISLVTFETYAFDPSCSITGSESRKGMHFNSSNAWYKGCVAKSPTHLATIMATMIGSKN